MPVVTPVATGQYRWRSETLKIDISSDVDQVVQRLALLTSADVMQLQITGQIDLAGHRHLLQAIGQTQGRVRCLLADASALRLQPTDDDVHALQADGYLGSVIADLRAGQDGPDAELARDALALLTGILDERRLAAS